MVNSHDAVGGSVDPVCEGLVSLPDATIASETGASVTYRRSFNRPTGIAYGDAVVFRSGLLPIASSIDFNGKQLGIPVEPLIDITDHLHLHNELTVKIAADQFPAASLASASLEIVHAEL